MAQFPDKSDASGIWSLMEVRNARMGDNWPLVALEIEYLVIAGGAGGGGGDGGGGGGAGGYRTNYTSSAPTPSPKLSGEPSGGSAIESIFLAQLGTAYTVTVGAGGTAG